jgi:hypothetical protein
MNRSLWFVVLMLGLVFAQGFAAAADSIISPGDWTPVVGAWEISGNAYKNTDTTSNNTIASAAVEQSGKEITIQWTCTFGPTDFSMGPAAGVHFLASEADSPLRGVSYLVFQDQNFIRLYKAFGSLMKTGDLPTPPVEPGQTFTYKVVFNTETGLMTVYRDGQEMGAYLDASPIQSGGYISLRTNGSVAEFKDVSVSVK